MNFLPGVTRRQGDCYAVDLAGVRIPAPTSARTHCIAT
jgi:hypothetical protein